MSRDINFFAEGEYYHAYNRGTEKRLIFLDTKDRERFISLLYLCNSIEVRHRSDLDAPLNTLLNLPRKKTLVDIGAYCLMPNHFHILFHEHTEGGISLFMQKLSTAYTMYFNKRHKRSGSLFQGRFRAEHVDRDEYLKYLFAYIHLNPIGIVENEWKEHKIKDKKNAEKFLNGYKFSSYLDYTENNERSIGGTIINKGAFPKYFHHSRDFRDFIKDWAEFEEWQ